MKRLTFKLQFVEKILDGRKCATIRPTKCHLKAGDTVSFVTRMGKTPAFLVKAENGFATAKIFQVSEHNREVLTETNSDNLARWLGFDSAADARTFYKRTLKNEKCYQIKWELINNE